MHRLVRIEGLHDFKYYNPLKFVLYDGSKYIILYGKIAARNHIVFEHHTYSMFTLFTGFGITSISAIKTYCKKQDPHCLEGIFPEHSSLDALKKTLISFFDLNMDIKIPPMYKVGDKVQIKSEYDLGSSAYDYPCSFTDMMLEMGSEEKTYTISSIHDLAKTATHYSQKHYKEPYYYKLQESTNWWSAAMFKGQMEELKSNQKDSVKITSIKDLTVSFTDGDSFKLHWNDWYYRGFCRVIKKVDRSFDGDRYGNIFHSRIICSKRDRCVEPEVPDGSLKWVILDYLKYYFGTEECKKTINPEFYKYLKKKPQQGIVEQIDYSQTKTQKHAYQFCKRRGTVCRGDVPEGHTVQGKRSKASVSSRSLAYRAVIGQ